MSQNQKRIIIVVAITIVVAAIVGIVMSIISNNQKIGEGRTNTVIIDNAKSYNKDIDDSAFISIGDTAYVIVNKNIQEGKEDTYHGIIRNSTFEKKDGTITFILDIESTKTSWKIAQGFNKDGEPLSDASVSCISEADAIYPMLKTCGDVSKGFNTPAQDAFLSMTHILPLAGPTYDIQYERTTENELGYTLVATVYGPTGQADAIAAFESFKYSINDYPVRFVQK